MTTSYDKDLYLVRFAHVHETFRLPELRALAEYHGVVIKVEDYRTESPFAIIRIPTPNAAALLISRAVLVISISHLWGAAGSYDDLHMSLKTHTSHLWPAYHTPSFRFLIDSFNGKRPQSTKGALIDSFGYMDMQGPIRPSDDSVFTFSVSEEYALHQPVAGTPQGPVDPSICKSVRQPTRVFLSLHLADSSRHLTTTYALKHRHYISTTSMDAELALVTANLALAGPGKVIYDPFCGTGSFLVAGAAYGALVAGSDLDGRVVRGSIKETRNQVVKAGKRREREQREKVNGVEAAAEEVERSVRGNLRQYGLHQSWLDGFVGDLTNSPVRKGRWLDAIVCDPPYGVREGLKVLGSHKPDLQEVVKLKDGTAAHLNPGYIPPKRPYSFDAMLADILTFASDTLVAGGRLCMWIPVEKVDEEDDMGAKDLGIPTHPCLERGAVSTQNFNKWSRRLVVYIRKVDSEIDQEELRQYNAMTRDKIETGTADELNEFRRRFFQGFVEARATGLAQAVV